MCRNLFFDVVIDLGDTVKFGDQVVSIRMYKIKHSDAENTFVNLDKNFIEIMFKDGKFVLRFKDSLDMLLFAKALYNAVIDMIVDQDFEVVTKLGEFLRVIG